MTGSGRTSGQLGATASGPVFVDASGKRLRRARLVGPVAVALAAGYVLLFILGVVGGPDIVAPYLPHLAGVGPHAETTVPTIPPSPVAQPPGSRLSQGSGPLVPAVPVRQGETAAPATPVTPEVLVTAGQGRAEAGAAPAAQDAGPLAPGAAPVAHAGAPVTHAAAPVAQGAAPVAHGAAPVAHAAAPVAQGAVQQPRTSPSTAPGKSGAAPGPTARPTPPPHR